MKKVFPGILLIIIVLFSVYFIDLGKKSSNIEDKSSFIIMPPSELTALPGNKSSKIYWSKSENAQSYNLIWWTEKNSEKQEIKNVESPYIHKGLSADTKYFYSVKAVSEKKESSESLTAHCTPYFNNNQDLQEKQTDKNKDKKVRSDKYAMPGQEIPEIFPDSGKPPERMPGDGKPSIMPDEGGAPKELPKALQVERFKHETRVIEYKN